MKILHINFNFEVFILLQYMARYRYPMKSLHINFNFEVDINYDPSHEHGRKLKKSNLLKEFGLLL
jgi:hypothetical protein